MFNIHEIKKQAADHAFRANQMLAIINNVKVQPIRTLLLTLTRNEEGVSSKFISNEIYPKVDSFIKDSLTKLGVADIALAQLSNFAISYVIEDMMDSISNGDEIKEYIKFTGKDIRYTVKKEPLLNDKRRCRTRLDHIWIYCNEEFSFEINILPYTEKEIKIVEENHSNAVKQALLDAKLIDESGNPLF